MLNEASTLLKFIVLGSFSCLWSAACCWHAPSSDIRAARTPGTRKRTGAAGGAAIYWSVLQILTSLILGNIFLARFELWYTILPIVMYKCKIITRIFTSYITCTTSNIWYPASLCRIHWFRRGAECHALLRGPHGCCPGRGHQGLHSICMIVRTTHLPVNKT